MHKQLFALDGRQPRHVKVPVTGYRRGSRQIAADVRRQRRAR